MQPPSSAISSTLSYALYLLAYPQHWHGFFQAGTNWADGGAFVNQCPISVGNSFLYDFTATDQAGTFWYHSHLSTQYCDGLRGAMVVYDPDDPHASLYDVDDGEYPREFSSPCMAHNSYHRVYGDHVGGLVSYCCTSRCPIPVSADMGGAEQKLMHIHSRVGGDSVLINGLGRFAGGDASDLAVINVTQGQRYRFRLVSISCDPNFTFTIQGHNMTVIEADGVSLEPTTVDSIQIYAGQRYSFVVSRPQSITVNSTNCDFVNGSLPQTKISTTIGSKLSRT